MSVAFEEKVFVSIRDRGELGQLSTFRGGPDLSLGSTVRPCRKQKAKNLGCLPRGSAAGTEVFRLTVWHHELGENAHRTRSRRRGCPCSPAKLREVLLERRVGSLCGREISRLKRRS